MQASSSAPTIFTGEATLPMTITGYCVTGIAPYFVVAVGTLADRIVK